MNRINRKQNSNRRVNRAKGFQKFVVGAMIVIAPLGIMTGCGATDAMNQRTETCTVSGKESVTVRSGDSQENQYRVYTEDCGTLTVQDTIVGFRYNSADLYGQIKEGETYEFEIGGFRQGLFDMFPNILSIQKVS